MTLSNTNQTLPTGVAQVEVPDEKKEVEKVTLTINPDVQALLRKENLDCNLLFIMVAMHDEKITLLDEYDDHNNNRKALLEYQELHMHGFFETSDESPLMYVLSAKGKDFVELVQAHFDVDAEEEKESTTMIRDLAAEYLLVFPKIKLPSGKYARTAPPEIEKKLKVFLKNYRPMFKRNFGFKLTTADILDAAKNYVGRYAKTGYQYMVTSSYFIQKNEKSALADEIIAMKQGTAKIVNKFEKQI